MKCFICNQEKTITGKTCVLFERGHMSLTICNVPARICPICGEAYTDESVTVNLLRQAESLASAGTKMDVCEYEWKKG